MTRPEDAMQIDSIPELPRSGGCRRLIKAMDVSSRYLFAYPTASQEAKTVARVPIGIMIKHA